MYVRCVALRCVEIEIGAGVWPAPVVCSCLTATAEAGVGAGAGALVLFMLDALVLFMPDALVLLVCFALYCLGWMEEDARSTYPLASPGRGMEEGERQVHHRCAPALLRN